MRHSILMIPVVMAVSGCSFGGVVLDTTTGAVATGIDTACEAGMGMLAMEARKDLVDEINSKTTVGNHTPSDCDGDGLGDFQIGADGMVVRP